MLVCKMMNFPFEVLISSVPRAQSRGMRSSSSALGSFRFSTEFLQEENESGIGLIFTSERLHFYFCPKGQMSG